MTKRVEAEVVEIRRLTDAEPELVDMEDLSVYNEGNTA